MGGSGARRRKRCEARNPPGEDGMKGRGGGRGPGGGRGEEEEGEGKAD